MKALCSCVHQGLELGDIAAVAAWAGTDEGASAAFVVSTPARVVATAKAGSSDPIAARTE